MLNLFHTILRETDFDRIQDILDKIYINLPMHLYRKDKRGVLRGCNRFQTKALGFNKEEDVIGFNDFDFLRYQDAEIFKATDQKIISSQNYVILPEKGICTLTGEYWEGMSCKMPLMSRTKKVCGIMGLSVMLIHPHSHIASQSTCRLTNRQIDCLFFLVKGMTIKEIGRQLKLSPKTIEHYMEAIKSKLHCTTRVQLIEKALQLSVIRARLLCE